jgi:hypothetical protein
LYSLGTPICLRTYRIIQHKQTKRQIASNKYINILDHEGLAKAEEAAEIKSVLFNDVVIEKDNMASVMDEQIGTSMENCWNTDREGIRIARVEPYRQ